MKWKKRPSKKRSGANASAHTIVRSPRSRNSRFLRSGTGEEPVIDRSRKDNRETANIRPKNHSQVCRSGRVSRASYELSAARNCTRDEGGPFEFGDQEPISSHRKLLRAKAVVVSVA